uniref:Uncharacterized protein n=1 Tax=Zea mays TaxID=4577 RepID=A0A804M2L4_MAIZE
MYSRAQLWCYIHQIELFPSVVRAIYTAFKWGCVQAQLVSRSCIGWLQNAQFFGTVRCSMYVLILMCVTITARACCRGHTSTAVPCYGSEEVANEGLRHKDNRWAFPRITIVFLFVKLQVTFIWFLRNIDGGFVVCSGHPERKC